MAAWKRLKKYAAGKPGAWEDHPWGETVYKVAKKVFVFLGHADGGYGLSCKLPQSGEAATTMFSLAHAMKSSLSNTDRCWFSQAPQCSPWMLTKSTQLRSFASATAASYE